MSKHTPTPWAVGYGERCVIKPVPDLADGYDHYAVAVTSAHGLLSVEEAKANSAFIVEAVNGYATSSTRIEALEKALMLALCWLAPNEPGDSRAVSNAYVAMADIQAHKDFSAVSLSIIDGELKKEAESSPASTRTLIDDSAMTGEGGR